jgi:hypothetical protein
MNVPQEVRELTESWLQDPIWDLEDTEGFEGYRDYLTAFAAQWKQRWQDERDAANRRAQLPETIGQLLVEMLAELRHIRAALAASGSVSSVQLEQNSKGINITVKSYESSDVESAGTAALVEFGRVFREVEQRQMDGWKRTVDALQNGGTS